MTEGRESPADAGYAVQDGIAHLSGFAGSALVLMISWINVLKCQFTVCLSGRQGPLNLLVGFFCHKAGLPYSVEGHGILLERY